MTSPGLFCLGSERRIGECVVGSDTGMVIPIDKIQTFIYHAPHVVMGFFCSNGGKRMIDRREEMVARIIRILAGADNRKDAAIDIELALDELPYRDPMVAMRLRVSFDDHGFRVATFRVCWNGSVKDVRVQTPTHPLTRHGTSKHRREEG